MTTIKDLWLQYAPKFKLVSQSPESDFRWILELVTGAHLGVQAFNSEKKLAIEQTKRAHELLQRRTTGEPVAYILGEWDFYGRTFFVGPGVLIPRPESELIIDLYKRFFKKDQRLKIVDLGSGSGCLAVTLALESQHSHVTAVEISDQAFEFLLKNADHFGLQGCRRFEAVQQDAARWCSAQPDEHFDLIVANPPYIEDGDNQVEKQVRDNEPHMALFSPEKGFHHFRQWSEHAARLLSSGGIFLCELGKGQDSVAVSYVTSLKVFGTVNVEPDLNGIPRTLIAVKN